jgi:hypothetical protein
MLAVPWLHHASLHTHGGQCALHRSAHVLPHSIPFAQHACESFTSELYLREKTGLQIAHTRTHARIHTHTHTPTHKHTHKHTRTHTHAQVPRDAARPPHHPISAAAKSAAEVTPPPATLHPASCGSGGRLTHRLKEGEKDKAASSVKVRVHV